MIWLIGNKGMLGQDVKKLLKRKRLSYLTSDKEIDIRDIETKEYPTPAQRPKCSLLSKEKIKKELNLDIRNWEDALTDFLNFLSLQSNRSNL